MLKSPHLRNTCAHKHLSTYTKLHATTVASDRGHGSYNSSASSSVCCPSGPPTTTAVIAKGFGHVSSARLKLGSRRTTPRLGKSYCQGRSQRPAIITAPATSVAHDSMRSAQRVKLAVELGQNVRIVSGVTHLFHPYLARLQNLLFPQEFHVQVPHLAETFGRR